MTLLNSGTLSYNGQAFTTMYRSKVTCKPIRDSAGRALVAREYTLDVEGRVAAAPGSTTDAQLTQMRQMLEVPAGALTLTSKGFGTLNVNVPGGQVWDMAYGPWPELLAWDPVGNDQACLVRWRCVTQVPCEEDPRQRGITEYTYTESWDIDEDGYTSRTIAGQLSIEATRAAVKNRQISDNADAYLDRVVPDLPAGFKRTQHRELSEDKRTVKFRFEDEELPQPLPVGVTRADVHHRVRWQMPKLGPMMSATISGSIILPAGQPKSMAWDKIMLIVRSRWPVGGRAVTADNWTGAPVAARGRATFYLQSVEVEDDMFGRGSSFTLTALVIGDAQSPQNVLSANGVWQALPGTDFVKMRRALFAKTGSGKPWAPRGMAGLTFQNSDDAIVDLCARATPPTVLQGKPTTAPKQLKSTPPPASKPGVLNPVRTWINYRLRLRLVERDRVARHKPLTGTAIQPGGRESLNGFIGQPRGQAILRAGGASGSSAGNASAGGASAAPGGDQNPQSAGVTSATPDLVQQVAAPSYVLRLEGWAVRLGYPIPTPRLQSLGGVTLTQSFEDVAQEIVSQVGAYPVYAASWVVEYIVPQMRQVNLPIAPNLAVS